VDGHSDRDSNRNCDLVADFNSCANSHPDAHANAARDRHHSPERHANANTLTGQSALQGKTLSGDLPRT
jgi:hypothetical protein